MTSYQIVLSFKTCEEISVLRSLSETKILDYFEELRRVFNQDEISQKRVVIQNLTSWVIMTASLIFNNRS